MAENLTSAGISRRVPEAVDEPEQRAKWTDSWTKEDFEKYHRSNELMRVWEEGNPDADWGI